VPVRASLPGLRVPHHHLLAQDRVYFVGHPVAVVVATDRYIARDAADLVEVEYEVELPAVADPEKALGPVRPPSIPNGPTTSRSPSTRKAATSDQAFREAEVVVKQRITSQRLIPTAMETRGVVAEWRAGDRADPLFLHPDSAPAAHAGGGILGMPENRCA
jgi:carbon-monoxide dehydrogenase large subunit